MNITSINAVRPQDFVARQRQTRTNQNVNKILEHMRTNGNKDLYIAGDDVKKFEAYSLQRALNKAGKHIVILQGTSSTTQKPILQVHFLNDAEWKEHLEGLKQRAERFKGGRKGKK